MRKPVLILAITSAGLAVSTVYLAFQLHAAREQLVAARLTPASSPSSRVTPNDIRAPASVFPATAPLLADGQKPVEQAGASKKEMDAATRASRYQGSAYLRKLLSDPERRARMERDTRKSVEKELSQFVQSLDMTEDERSRLFDLLTAHQMRYAETVSRCTDTPGCDANAAGAAQFQAQRRELADFMGAEKAQRFADYRDNFMERNSVAGFRADLPDALQISDAQAEQLASVLGEERRRVVKEWEQRGAGVASLGNSFGDLFYPNNVPGIEERVAEASEFQRRQRERAAEVLTVAQLEAFTERQKDILDIARSGWESAEQSSNSGQN